MSTNHQFAWALALSGLIPFWALALCVALFPDVMGDAAFLTLALKAYGACILSFLGGVRWGAALDGPGWKKPSLFALSTIPSLVGWVAILLPDSAGLALLISGFVGQALWDISASRAGLLPDWFGRLRMVISAAAVTALLLAVSSL